MEKIDVKGIEKLRMEWTDLSKEPQHPVIPTSFLPFLSSISFIDAILALTHVPLLP
jgi:hypothetical protein